MEVVIRATAIFFFLLVAVRAVGRRELSEMSAFELLVLVTMGDLVQQAVTQEDMSVMGGVLAVGTFATWSVIIGYITYRSKRADKVITGVPVLVVKDGELIRDVLEMERIPESDVLEAARQQGIADLAKVYVGIVESDGQFSFIRTDDKPPQNATQRKKAE